MKRNLTLFLVCMVMAFHLHAQVAINTDGSTPNPSAMLDVKSTNNGILIPRLTTAQRLAIASPAEGLLVYDTNLGAFSYYHSGAWTLNLTNASGWSLTGNTGTNPATNFIGTTDNQSLVFSANNIRSGWIDVSGRSICSFGYNSLGISSTAWFNVAFGTNALHSSTYGGYNSAFGDNALSSNTSGERNSAFGISALSSNTEGGYNSSFGSWSLASNSAGNWNSSFGYSALNSNKSDFNSAFGYNCLENNTTGSNNSAFGPWSLHNNVGGNNNTAFGTLALYSNTSGNFNTAFGDFALNSNMTGNANVAVGPRALYSNSATSNLVAVGDSALMNNTGSGNTAVGSKCLLANTSGTNNTALGSQADVAGNNLTNSTAIGQGAIASSSNEIRLGNDAVSSVYCKGAYTSTTTNSANVYVSSTGQIMRTTSAPSASSCIDIDGNGYPTFLIGNQVWMAENLRVTHYRNGEEIPNVTDATAWAALTTGAYCWPGNSQSVSAKFGVFYNHYTVTDSRQLCPAGWHVPSNTEWTALSTYLGGESVAGGKMKSVSALWASPNTDAVNNSGFSGLPGGYRDASGVFQPVGEFPPPSPGFWWTSSYYCSFYPCPQTVSYDRSLHYDGATLTNGHDGNKFGFSVRCLRD